MKKTIKRMFPLLLVWIILLTSIISVSATSDVQFSVSNVTDVLQNSNFNVDVNYNGKEPLKINGIFLRLSFDKSKVTCSPSSEKMFVDGMSDCITNVIDGEMIFMWESVNSVTLRPGKILQFTFQATQAFSETKIVPIVEMLYVIEKHDIKDIDVGNTLPGIISAISSARAKKVEMEIDQIDNPVVLTNDCNTKIVKAWNSYCALTGAEKLLVKNYETLVAAMKKYAELQRNSENDPVSAEVNEFTNKYSYALALTKLTATTEKDSNGNYKDIEALNTAIRALEGLSVQAQVILMPNKNTMKSVLYYLQEQIKEELEEAEAAERERKQREAAKEAVEDFLNQPYKWVLDLTVDKVTTDDETGVRTALSGLESAEINKYAIEMLAEKKKLLQDLLKKILELKINAEPEKAEAIISAEEFKNRFSSVLSLTPDSVTRDDEVDVNIANYAYELLSADAKLYLEKEGKLLASLMDAIASLPSDETENERHEEQDNDSNSAGNISETVKEVIKRIADNSQYSVKILERNMSNIVWVLLAAIGILSLNLIVCYGFYNKAKCQIKKYDLRRKSNGIE